MGLILRPAPVCELESYTQFLYQGKRFIDEWDDFSAVLHQEGKLAGLEQMVFSVHRFRQETQGNKYGIAVIAPIQVSGNPGIVVHIRPNAHDGKIQRLREMIRIASLRAGNSSQNRILLKEPIPQGKGHGVPHPHAIGFRIFTADAAYRIAFILSADQSTFQAQEPILLYPANCGHVVCVHHIKGMYVILGDLYELTQRGKLIRFQII